HFCPVCPLTMTVLHASTPLQSLASRHESGASVQENVQLVSQPVFGPFPAPKSQASPISVMPLPQTALGALHTPFWQTKPPPHGTPSGVGSARGAHTCWAVHVCTSHAGGAAQSIAGITQENKQVLSHPSPFMMFPSSHCSPGSTTLSPHMAGLQ